jgi:hypothetical protein
MGLDGGVRTGAAVLSDLSDLSDLPDLSAWW